MTCQEPRSLSLLRHLSIVEQTVPRYQVIRESLAEEIKRHFGPGDQLPSESQLAERFAVNRHTLRRSVDLLVQDGLVERRRGVGLFVLEPLVDYPLKPKTRLSANLRHSTRGGKRKPLRRFIEEAGENIARRLEIPTGTPVICLEFLIMTEGATFSLATHYFEAERWRRIYDAFRKDDSLHEFIEREYGIELYRSKSLISCSLPEERDASNLLVPKTLPLITVKSVNVDLATNKPVEYVKSRFRSDRVELSVHF